MLPLINAPGTHSVVVVVVVVVVTQIPAMAHSNSSHTHFVWEHEAFRFLSQLSIERECPVSLAHALGAGVRHTPSTLHCPIPQRHLPLMHWAWCQAAHFAVWQVPPVSSEHVVRVSSGLEDTHLLFNEHWPGWQKHLPLEQ